MFLKVDVDKAEDVSADNGISAMPTFIFFKKEAKVNPLSQKEIYDQSFMSVQ